MKTVNLDELEKAAHTVTRGGVSYRVRPATGRVLNMVAAAEAADAIGKMRAYYDIAALLVPTMSRDDVEDLSPDQVAMIMTLSRGEIEAVEEAAADPNAVSPATKKAPSGKRRGTSSGASS